MLCFREIIMLGCLVLIREKVGLFFKSRAKPRRCWGAAVNFELIVLLDLRQSELIDKKTFFYYKITYKSHLHI